MQHNVFDFSIPEQFKALVQFHTRSHSSVENSMKTGTPFLVVILAALMQCGSSLSIPPKSRRAFVASSVLLPQIANAFEGSGSSSYSGRTPASKAEKASSYKDRVAADVKDFNKLGAAIDNGELDPESDAWIAFFIPFQRRQPDAAGRSYAAQLDLIGAEKTGGAGLLLAATFAKPNKPPNNLPQYKKYEALAANLDAIKKAGKSGDVAKTKKEWSTAAAAFSDYLESVEMPRDLSDRLYK